MKTVVSFLIFWSGANLYSDPILLNTGAGNFTTSRPQEAETDQGTGQGVSVSTTTFLTGMGMDLDLPNGGNIKYMIWDGTDSTLLFSETQSVAASSTLSFVQSTPLAFTLNAGSSYFFGVISDQNQSDSQFNISAFVPAITLTQNGLSILPGNTNYDDFASPIPILGGGATIALELIGTQTQVPEPAALPVIAAVFCLLAFKRFSPRKAGASN
jgi:hypothetical protein